MSFFNKYSCIFCKYKKESIETCQSHGECYSLSNIYYGTLIKYFPFKQIFNLMSLIETKKYDKEYKKMETKYGDASLENDNSKFIWGVKSWDDLSGQNCNLFTMNDINIIYDKKKKVYILGVETAYIFETIESECAYLRSCLNAFTKFMKDNHYEITNRFNLFMGNPCIDISAETLEDLYTQFRIFVEGFCKINEEIEIFSPEKNENSNIDEKVKQQFKKNDNA